MRPHNLFLTAIAQAPMGAWNLTDPHLGLLMETASRPCANRSRPPSSPDKSSAHNRDIQREARTLSSSLGATGAGKTFKRIYRRILQLIGDSILRAAIQEEGSLDGIEMDGNAHGAAGPNAWI